MIPLRPLVPLFALLATAACVANVVGPGGAPLTDPQIEQLVAHEPGRTGGEGCRWRHSATDTSLAAGTHEQVCPVTGRERDSTRTAVTYVQDRHGRWAMRISDPYLGERCRIDREKREELGTLRCWQEWRY